MKLDVRYNTHPEDSKHYDTATLRRHYLIEKLFVEDEITLTYSHQDRIIVGGVMPVKSELKLGACKELATDYFLQRREMGVINVGGDGLVIVDGKQYEVKHKEGMYVGMGAKQVVFRSKDKKSPAKFYVNSCLAHKTYPTVHVTAAKVNRMASGDSTHLNKRVVNQYVHPTVCESCQLSMGITEIDPTSNWSTIPCYTHERRVEVYMYFDLHDDNVVVHLMGTKDETRHVMVHNEQAVISPSWSIHSGVGTSNYSYVWGMCGENQTFTDFDVIGTLELK